MNDILITNIGTIVSGDIERGVLVGKDTISVRGGKIQRIGVAHEFDQAEFPTVIDANGQTAIPGFVDAHVHNGMEDYSACLRMAGMLEDALLNGTTTMISEGEQGPGYPRFYNDTEGIKAEAVFANRLYKRFRPGNGLKLHAGALVLSDGLVERDFETLRELGIWNIAEIGGGGTGNMKKLRRMVGWAKKYGYFVSVHLAPPSIPGSTWLHAEDVIALQPDKVAHANGGTTGSDWSEIKQVIDETDAGIELIPEGNYVNFNMIIKYMAQKGQLGRILFGSDAPTGACPLSGAMNKAVTRASCLNNIPAYQAIAFATGNAANLYRLPVGKLETGREADIVVIDAPPGSVGIGALGAAEAGDLFGCSLVVVDGQVVGLRGRDTRATQHNCLCGGEELRARDLHEFLFDPPTRIPARMGLGGR